VYVLELLYQSYKGLHILELLYQTYQTYIGFVHFGVALPVLHRGVYILELLYQSYIGGVHFGVALSVLHRVYTFSERCRAKRKQCERELSRVNNELKKYSKDTCTYIS
jgi:hypothetical protein